MVPEHLKKSVLKLAHDNIVSRHLGIAKTKERIKRHFFWPSLAADVENYVKACAICNRSKHLRRKYKAPMRSFTAGAPMEKCHLDILSPLPKTASGNSYVLLMVDQFTKWVEAAPIPDQSAETVARTAIDYLFSRFGCPREIVTDQGANFNSQLCEMLEIAKKRTTPYHPSANGQVERLNRTLLQMIRCTIRNGQSNWDKQLQLLIAAVRCTVNRSTGFTPNRLMLGREVTQPLQLMTGVPEERAPMQEFVEQVQLEMKNTHEIARQTLQGSQIRQKRDYHIHANAATYAIGDVGAVNEFGIEDRPMPKVSSTLERSVCDRTGVNTSLVSNSVEQKRLGGTPRSTKTMSR